MKAGRIYPSQLNFSQGESSAGPLSCIAMQHAARQRIKARDLLDKNGNRSSKKHNLDASMCIRRNCHDKDVAKSLCQLLKRELIRPRTRLTLGAEGEGVFS